jgi:hypothetical protein
MKLRKYSYYYRTRQGSPPCMRNIKTSSQVKRWIIQTRVLLIEKKILWPLRRSAPHSDESYSIDLPILAPDSLVGNFCDTGTDSMTSVLVFSVILHFYGLLSVCHYTTPSYNMKLPWVHSLPGVSPASDGILKIPISAPHP